MVFSGQTYAHTMFSASLLRDPWEKLACAISPCIARPLFGRVSERSALGNGPAGEAARTVELGSLSDVPVTPDVGVPPETGMELRPCK